MDLAAEHGQFAVVGMHRDPMPSRDPRERSHVIDMVVGDQHPADVLDPAPEVLDGAEEAVEILGVTGVDQGHIVPLAHHRPVRGDAPDQEHIGGDLLDLRLSHAASSGTSEPEGISRCSTGSRGIPGRSGGGRVLRRIPVGGYSGRVHGSPVSRAEREYSDSDRRT